MRSIPNNQPKAEGKDAILKSIKSDIDSDTTITSTSFEVIIVFAHGDLAAEVGKSTKKDANKLTSASGHGMSVCRCTHYNSAFR
jgi:hypothetical protein